jgi:hypothetical protein
MNKLKRTGQTVLASIALLGMLSVLSYLLSTVNTRLKVDYEMIEEAAQSSTT